VNEQVTIDGILYDKVPDSTGMCNGCAFYKPNSPGFGCTVPNNPPSCIIPVTIRFVLAGKSCAKPEPDEQCGVGNG
jgi:hypothetical protein